MGQVLGNVEVIIDQHSLMGCCGIFFVEQPDSGERIKNNQRLAGYQSPGDRK